MPIAFGRRGRCGNRPTLPPDWALVPGIDEPRIPAEEKEDEEDEEEE